MHLVNRYELREVEETVNVCIHRSKGYSSLYLEEVSEQIKIRQEIFKKCVQLRNQPLDMENRISNFPMKKRGGFHPPSR